MGRKKHTRVNIRKILQEDDPLPDSPGNSASPEPDEQFFAVKMNPFDPLEDGEDTEADSASRKAEIPHRKTSQDSSLVQTLSSELKALEEKLAKKRGKIQGLKSTRDTLKLKVDSSYEQIKQLKNSQNKAKSLEEHNRQLQCRNSDLQQEKEALELQVLELDREVAALCSMQKELDCLNGYGLDSLTLEQCQDLLNSSTEALVKIEDALRIKTEEMVASKKCLNCSQGVRSILLLPCGHFALCDVCAETEKTCPVCETLVGSKVKVHSS